MAMNPFHGLTQQLAHQLDRRILHLEEADHYRLDIPAHETLTLPVIAVPRDFMGPMKRFAIAALTIYMGLFSITNMGSYSKIAMASLQEAMEYTEAPVIATQLTQDPWTGERIAEHYQAPETLTALEEASLQPENGILPLDLTPTTYEDRVSIPSLGIDAPIVQPELGVEALVSQDWNELEDQIRSSLLEGVVHYPGTAEPGQIGNAFLTGHSSNVFWERSAYNSVFALLPRIQVGDEITITYNQNEYTYRVITKEEVNPKNVSVLEQGDSPILTLMTCTPVGTTLKRLVVRAELITD